jgi:regulator of replication initiation timing
MLKIMKTKDYVELVKASLKMQEFSEEIKRLQMENEKLKQELEDEKEKNTKEAKKKSKMRVDATKKWLNGYPNE